MKLKIGLCLSALLPGICSAQLTQPMITQQDIIDQAYFAGRDYYILRSGRAKMVIQADRVSLGPSFQYLLYDAETTKQTERKKYAFNYTPFAGFCSSALEVVMRGFPLTALGTQTQTCWIIEEGRPSVEACWWASGVKVREVITPLTNDGLFRRSIFLESAALVDVDTLSLRLSLPYPATLRQGNIALWNDEQVGIALMLSDQLRPAPSEAKNQLTSEKIVLRPGESKRVDTYLLVSIPSVPSTQLCEWANTLVKEGNRLQSNQSAFVNRWNNSNTITTMDEVVRNMHDVARYTLPGYVSEQGRMDAGMFEYGGQWVRDASHTALGMVHIGEFELARAMLDHMLKNMISEEGTTMIYSNFEQPDYEQLDQMGEFMLVMKSYLDWTGDASLLIANRAKLIAMIQRPLNPVFLDETGMVHNRRELWERIFDDAYEMVYQTWVISGLRNAVSVAHHLGAEELAPAWKAAADKMQDAMLKHPTMKLVEDGHLIKRRNRTGEVVDRVTFNRRMAPGAPAAVESHHSLMPDATMAIPIALGVIDPASEIAHKTLDQLESLWNLRWSFGGYERYNSSTQVDQPGPWTFATTFIMRGQHEAGMYERSRRALEWLYANGGHTGVWLEQIPILKHQERLAGALPWTTGEVSYFIVHHMLGVKFEGEQLSIFPRLFPGSPPLSADLRYKESRFTLEVSGSGAISHALINGTKVRPNRAGRIMVPLDFTSGKIQVFTRQ